VTDDITGNWREIRVNPRISTAVLLTLLTVLAAGPPAASGQAPQPRAVLAADVFDLQLEVDTTIDIMGETRFFSSRFQRYVGGRFTAHGALDPAKTFRVGSFGGFVWGKSAFLLNWEEPGLMSFDPLEASIATFSVPIGVELDLRLGDILCISPYASAKLMWLRMKISIDDEDFSGSAWKMGFDAGVRAALSLGSFTLTGGAGLTHILNDEIDFEVDDLTFNSKTAGSSPEYFLGVQL
jgi:hypothetical protein